jgi:excisionase family DNA binding protein
MARYEHGLLSEPQAAAYLGVSARTVRRFVDDGSLDRVRLGASPAYPWTSVWRLVGVNAKGREQAYVRRLLTVDDVAKRCVGFAPSKIKRLAASGEIPAHRVGKAWRFVPAELDAWLLAATEVRTENGQESGDLATAEPNSP